MNLKTLKDLEIVGHEVVRAEGVKWIKNANEISAYTNDTNEPLKTGWGFDNIEDFIKHFFNITEEDLK